MNILFTWEIGLGLGHIAPYVPLLKRLEEDGHKVTVSMRYINNAVHLFKDSSIRVMTTPYINLDFAKINPPTTDNMAGLLYGFGYSDVDTLKSLMISWMDLLELTQADLVIAEYSPSALLAANLMGVKSVRIGAGAFCPTTKYPMPTIRELQLREPDIDDPESVTRKTEDFIFNNVLLAIDQLNLAPTKPLRFLGDIFDADDEIITGVTEVDHMLDRTGRDPIGILRNDIDRTVEWPEGDKKIFIYVHAHHAIPTILKWCNSSNYAVVIHGSDFQEEHIKEMSSDKIVFSKYGLSITKMVQEADICINSGNFTSTMEFLLEGKPVVMLPTHGEQAAFAVNVCDQGLGAMVISNEPVEYLPAINKVLFDEKIHENVKQFAQKYCYIDNDYYISRAMGVLTKYL